MTDPTAVRQAAEQAAADEPQVLDQLALLMQLHQDVLAVQRMCAVCVGLCALLTAVAVAGRISSNPGLGASA